MLQDTTSQSDISTLSHFLKNSTDISACNGHETALTQALKDNKIAILEALINNNADINTKNRDGKTVLNLAAEAQEEGTELVNKIIKIYLTKNCLKNGELNKYFYHHILLFHQIYSDENLYSLISEDNFLEIKTHLRKIRTTTSKEPPYDLISTNYNINEVKLVLADIISEIKSFKKLSKHPSRKEVNQRLLELSRDLQILPGNSQHVNEYYSMEPESDTPTVVTRSQKLDNTQNFKASCRPALDFKLNDIKTLLENGANLNFQDASGNTPLMIAAENNNTHFFQELSVILKTMPLESKTGKTGLTTIDPNTIDYNLKNHKGETALSIATKLSLIQQSRDQYQSHHYSANHPQIIEILLELKSDAIINKIIAHKPDRLEDFDILTYLQDNTKSTLKHSEQDEISDKSSEIYAICKEKLTKIVRDKLELDPQTYYEGNIISESQKKDIPNNIPSLTTLAVVETLLNNCSHGKGK